MDAGTITPSKEGTGMDREQDWRKLPEITSIGPIPVMGDNYYDGVIEAHNDNFFITRCDQIHEKDEDGIEISNSYESVYFVYNMDPVFRLLLESDVGDHHAIHLLFLARDYAAKLPPIGYIMEGNLERSNEKT